jgi:acetate kinase
LPTNEPGTFVYVLRHGGQVFTTPFRRLSDGVCDEIAHCAPFWPQENSLTLKVARKWHGRMFGATHLVACETAFFADLPPQTANYALPADIASKGIRRYGYDGICHAWACRQAHRYSGGTARRIVSLHLANRSTCAALRDGVPVDVSAGLTPLEGLLSVTGSGDLDPSVSLILREAGMPAAEIAYALSSESGFAALLKRPCGIEEVLEALDPGAGLARQMLRHGILKQIGAGLALLGGADMLVFANEGGPAGEEFLAGIARGLAFLNVTYSPMGEARELGEPRAKPTAGTLPALSLRYRHELAVAQAAAAYLQSP